MIERKNIIAAAGMNTYYDGIDIIGRRGVRDATYNTAGYPKIKLNSHIKDGREYVSSASINADDGRILSFFCSCGSRLRPCRHVTALLTVFADAVEDGRIVLQKPRRETSELIEELMKGSEDTAAGLPADISGRYIIEPIFELTDSFLEHTLNVSFRCGRKDGKMFVLRSIHELVQAVKKHSVYEFGKRERPVLCEESFDSKYLPLLRFLQGVDQADDQIVYRRLTYWDQYYNPKKVALGKEISLKGNYLDSFVEAVEGISCYERREGRKVSDIGSPIRFIREPFTMNTELKKEGSGFVFSVQTEEYVTGAKYVYIYRDGVFNCVPADSGIRRLLVFAETSYGEEQYIRDQDMRMFARKMQGVLEKHTSVVQTGALTAYLPPKPVFRIYLDMPQNDLVTGELKAVYGEKTYNILDETKKNLDAALRNQAEEEMMNNFFAKYFNSFDAENKRWGAFGEDAIYEVLTTGVEEMRKRAEVFISDKLKRVSISDVPRVHFGVSVKHDLLQLELTGDEMDLETLSEIMSRYTPKKKYYRLKNGDFIMADESLDQLASLKDELGISNKDIRNGNAEIPKYRALLLEERADENEDLFDRDGHFRDLVEEIHDTESREYEIPAGLNGTLRDYQKKGFQWMNALYDNGFAALLADEMGLGKTIQVIAFILCHSDIGRTLIVCPASLVYNWQSEIQRFAPSLNSVMVVGNAQERKQILQDAGPRDIIITSYDLLKRDIEEYQKMRFSTEIIDEAQFIKNASTQASRAVKKIRSAFRIALTGTPIENKLSELWSIFDYLMPGFLYRYSVFRTVFENPIVKDQDEIQAEKLRQMIAPFVLRRLKKEVLQDLPDKLEDVYFAPLEGEQRELYEARVKALRISLGRQSDQEFKENKLQVLAELTRLRQICCSPSLVYENYRGNSGKEDLCIDLLSSGIEEGHKILLFSQFTTMLDLLTERMRKEGIKYHLLTGATPKQQRAEMVESFAEDDVPVFCISTRAGGTGLNLTAADIVIHYDPWWNTAVEDQATDRTHRIGQTNVVSVCRLITKDTVEERIIELQRQKADLADQILSGEEMSRASFTREELLSILQ